MEDYNLEELSFQKNLVKIMYRPSENTACYKRYNKNKLKWRKDSYASWLNLSEICNQISTLEHNSSPNVEVIEENWLYTTTYTYLSGKWTINNQKKYA